ncbi:MAG: ATP-grasp domain-containing protein [Lachnospiraceae bacterium]|nr:ATP-grasp domain-containing protein [Lachnospiraceae bacterium]
MKKLMIMGAGIYQVPLIKTAREMGIYTIAVSIPGKYPGFAYADEVLHINTVDAEAVLQAAKERKIDGICTAGTDVAVMTIGRVNDELGLSGISYSAARIACDKVLMKQCYEEHGVRTARYRKVYFNENVDEKIEGLQYPLIIKIVDSSGSRGITRVDRPDQIQAAITNAQAYTRKDYYIVEEFIIGREFGAQAFVMDGKVQFILPHGDYIFHGSTGVPAGHFAPYELSEEAQKDCCETCEKAILAMGLDNCAVNCDFIMRDGKTYVLEIGGRSGATCLAELVSIYYGYDYYKKIIEVALGQKPDFPKDKAVPNASKLLMSDKDGEIIALANRNPKSDSNICEVCFDYTIGDQVKKFHVGPNRIGHVVTKGRTLAEATAALDRALKNIEIEVV